MPVTHPGRGRLRRAAASVRPHARQHRPRHADEVHNELLTLYLSPPGPVAGVSAGGNRALHPE